MSTRDLHTIAQNIKDLFYSLPGLMRPSRSAGPLGTMEATKMPKSKCPTVSSPTITTPACTQICQRPTQRAFQKVSLAHHLTE